MRRLPFSARRFLVAPIAALVVSMAGANLASGAGFPSLYVDYVSTNCTFTLVGDSGARVTSIPPGTYQLLISQTDYVSCGDGLPTFVFTGPGVKLATNVDEGTGAGASFSVTLLPNSTYVMLDGNAPVISRISFTTTSTGTAASVAVPSGGIGQTTSSNSEDVLGPTKKPVTYAGTLKGSVDSAGNATLTNNGKAISSIVAGRYKVVVVDQSATAGFIIQQTGNVARVVTTSAFKGSKSATVFFKKGQSLFYPSIVGKKRTFTILAAT